MSKEYYKYVKNHIKAVNEAAEWLWENGILDEKVSFPDHDLSKYSKEEYGPYDRHFYPEVAGPEEVGEFEAAVRHHYAVNPHHPQYWLGEDGIPQDMPERYVVEMVCDLMSFGIARNNPAEIADYYLRNGDKMPLSPKTRARLEWYIGEIVDKQRENERRS